MSERALHLISTIVPGLVGLGHGVGAAFCLMSARRRPEGPQRRRRMVLGFLLMFPAILLSSYALVDIVTWLR